MRYATLLPSHETVRSVLHPKSLRLPSLPLVAVRLLELTLDDHSSAGDLARVIETDPALAGRILGIVNSAAYGLPRKIASVSQAVALLGFAGIRALALGVTLFEKVVPKEGNGGFDRLFFWQHCLAVAELARILAVRLGQADPEEAYIAGLLHDVGKIILETHGRKGYSDLCSRRTAADGATLVEDEARFVGLSHDRLGAFFCAHWQLPEPLVLAVLFHHGRFDHLDLPRESATLIAIVSLANFFSWLQGLGSLNLQQCPSLQPEVTALIDLKALDRDAVAAEMLKGLAAAAEIYGFTLPAGGWAEPDQPGAASARLNAQHHYLKDILARKVATQPPTNLETRPGTPERITAVLRSIARICGFDRLQVLGLDSRRRCLQPVASLDRSPLGLSLADFEIPLTPAAGGLFEALRDGVPRIIRGQAAGHDLLIGRLQAAEIGLIPLHWDSQPAGLLWVDNALGNAKLTETDLATAARMAAGLGRDLAARGAAARPAADPAGGDRQAVGAAAQKAYQAARGGNRELCAVLVAVENLQPPDQHPGHLTAETLVRLVAGIIRSHCGPEDRVMSLGDGRFLLLAMDREAPRALALGKRLRREIADLGRVQGPPRCGSPLKASIGLALLTPGIQTWQELTRQASLALEAARAQSAGRTILYSRPGGDESPKAPPRDDWRSIFLKKDFLSAG